MVFVAVALPPMMLGLLLVLGRYEERMFGPGQVERPARARGHLSLVPGTGSAVSSAEPDDRTESVRGGADAA